MLIELQLDVIDQGIYIYIAAERGGKSIFHTAVIMKPVICKHGMKHTSAREQIYLYIG